MHFGQQILNEDGEINRKALGKIVFSDKDMLMKLNSMTHPYMHQRIERVIREEKAKGQYDLIVLEAAVMIEAKFNELANEMWFITCDIDTRIERLMTYRKLEKDRIINIISRQHSDEFYEKHADYTINNSGTIENTYKQIERLLKE